MQLLNSKILSDNKNTRYRNKKAAEVGFSDFRRLFTGHIKLFSHDLRFFVTAFGANAVFVERDSAERATA